MGSNVRHELRVYQVRLLVPTSCPLDPTSQTFPSKPEDVTAKKGNTVHKFSKTERFSIRYTYSHLFGCIIHDNHGVSLQEDISDTDVMTTSTSSPQSSSLESGVSYRGAEYRGAGESREMMESRGEGC